MVGTNDIFCTPKANLLHISTATLTKNQFKVEEAKRNVAIMATGGKGLESTRQYGQHPFRDPGF